MAPGTRQSEHPSCGTRRTPPVVQQLSCGVSCTTPVMRCLSYCARRALPVLLRPSCAASPTAPVVLHCRMVHCARHRHMQLCRPTTSIPRCICAADHGHAARALVLSALVLLLGRKWHAAALRRRPALHASRRRSGTTCACSCLDLGRAHPRTRKPGARPRTRLKRRAVGRCPLTVSVSVS